MYYSVELAWLWTPIRFFIHDIGSSLDDGRAHFTSTAWRSLLLGFVEVSYFWDSFFSVGMCRPAWYQEVLDTLFFLFAHRTSGIFPLVLFPAWCLDVYSIDDNACPSTCGFREKGSFSVYPPYTMGLFNPVVPNYMLECGFLAGIGEHFIAPVAFHLILAEAFPTVFRSGHLEGLVKVNLVGCSDLL